MSKLLLVDMMDHKPGEDVTNFIQCSVPSVVQCLCCLSKDTSFIKLQSCSHASLLVDLLKFKLELEYSYICYMCHSILKKIFAFQKQIKCSYMHLTESQPPPITTTPEMTVAAPEIISITTPSEMYDDITKVTLTQVELVEGRPVTTEAVFLDESLDTDDKYFDQDKTLTKLNVPPQAVQDQAAGSKKQLSQNGSIRRLLVTPQTLAAEREALRASDGYRRMEYKCDTCIVGFNYKEKFEEHVARKHDKSKKMVCNICAATLADEATHRQHERRHYMRFECAECGNRYQSATSATHHRHAAHGAATLRCGRCDFTCAKPRVMHYHMEKHKGPFKCEHCAKTLSSATCLRQHIVALHTAGGAASAAAARRRDRTAQQCAACGRAFRSRRAYREHLRTAPEHRAEYQHKYTCDYCQAKYYYKSELALHIQWRHLRVTRFKCAQCNDRPFRRNSDLLKHQRSFHDGVKVDRPRKWICEVCGKGFMHNTTLQDHMTRHTNERPHRCRVCDATFGFRAALYTHTRRLHPAAT